MQVGKQIWFEKLARAFEQQFRLASAIAKSFLIKERACYNKKAFVVFILWTVDCGCPV